jgi:hypothetical protein
MEFAMWHSEPAADESASVLLRRTSKKLLAKSSMPVQLTESEAHWNSTETISPALREKISTWAAENRPIYELLEQLPNRKPGGTPVEARSWEGIKVDELTHALQTKARVELEDDPNAAAKTISLMLYFARALENERFYAFTGANRVLKSAMQLLERVAAQGGFPAENWREWKAILADANPIATLRINFVFTRAQGLEAFAQPVPALYQQFGSSMGDFPALFNIGWSIRRFFGQDRVEVIEFLDELNADIGKADQPFWQVRNGPMLNTWRAPSIGSSTIIAPQLEPAFDWIFNTTTEMVARQRILMTVCDLEIYRAEHGSLPSYPNEIPTAYRIDPFTGNQLRFVARGNEYTVYSAGEDRNDDGGVGPSGHHTGDIPFSCGKGPERIRATKNP